MQRKRERWREGEEKSQGQRYIGPNTRFSCSGNLKPQMTASVVLNVKMDRSAGHCQTRLNVHLARYK